MKHEGMTQFIIDFFESDAKQLQKLGAFCRTKEPGKKYNYTNIDNCAIGQWYKSRGRNYREESGLGVLEYFASIEPHTFGALADRIKYASSIDFQIARLYG